MTTVARLELVILVVAYLTTPIALFLGAAAQMFPEATQLVPFGPVLLRVLVCGPIFGTDPTIADLADLADEDVRILFASRRVRTPMVL